MLLNVSYVDLRPVVILCFKYADLEIYGTLV